MIPARRAVLGVLVVLAATGCAGPTYYVHPTYDFSVVKKVAVLPLENLTPDQLAAERVRKAVVSELLAAGILDVVEPGQVNRALAQLGIQTPTALSTEELKKLGSALGVQALVVGSVDTYDRLSLGGASFPEFALTLRVVDAATGTIVWSASHSGGGVGVVGRLFGFGGASMSTTVQKTIRQALATLFQ